MMNFHFYNLIKLFYEKTGVPILFNTSFNLAGDPLVETLDDALYTLRNSNLDYLYLPEIKSMIHVPKEIVWVIIISHLTDKYFYGIIEITIKVW